jgi:nucleoside-diphosphate-sugar epimerase
VIDLAGVAKLMVDLNGSGEYEEREFPADRRAIDIGDYYADFSKIRNALGWKPKRTLRETIQATLNYFRDALPHYL